MKGIIFKEFLDMVEQKFGYEMVDKIITDSNLPNDGAYTSVGTYPHAEMVALVGNLSKYSNISVPKLLETYGEHAFGIFVIAYAHLINIYPSAFEFLAHVEDTIHVEVLKLYPEAELPSLYTIEKSNNKMIMVYQSTRAMADFAIGLIKGCLLHFNEKAIIQKLPLKDDQTEVEFTLTINA